MSKKKNTKKTTKKTTTPLVTREEVKAKMGEVNKAIDELKEDSVSAVKVAAILGIALLVGVAFLSGRRKALRPKTLLKIVKTK